MVEHDRVILLHLAYPDCPRYYRVLLGQGLFGFEAVCRRQSEGVWFRVSGEEFQHEWDRF
jgi:hypothetical protein